ncbi:hypothetical protein EDB89DRAFT_2150894 [Lactarius sanguifluus]|nr:hypothetical protein EDB89DRAFT_2150894 [Lactarius sanguifluus]
MDLLCSAKSACEWTKNELDAYNINVKYQDSAAFFGQDDLPLPQVDRELLNTVKAADMVIPTNAILINYLDQAMMDCARESTVDNFSSALLRELGFQTNIRLVCTQVALSYMICGMSHHADPNICVLDHAQDDIILMIQENKNPDPQAPCAQLMAQAIAAFRYNNQRWVEPLATEMILGITVVSTAPTFYRIPVTIELADHVRDGTFPPAPTPVIAHTPLDHLPVPPINSMKPLINRHTFLHCYEVFRQMVDPPSVNAIRCSE